jgi:phage shock protein E
VSFFLQLLGLDDSVIKNKLREGAVIIDVRSPHAYDQGKVPHSLNIPIEQIEKNVGYLRRLKKPVIICGAGSDPGVARRILQSHGLKDVHNGGRWERVLRISKTL